MPLQPMPDGHHSAPRVDVLAPKAKHLADGQPVPCNENSRNRSRSLLAHPGWGPVGIDTEVEALLWSPSSPWHSCSSPTHPASGWRSCVSTGRSGAAPRHRSATLDRPRRDPRGADVRFVPVGPRRVHRRRPGSNRRRSERAGDQRQARSWIGFGKRSTWRAGSTATLVVSSCGGGGESARPGDRQPVE